MAAEHPRKVDPTIAARFQRLIGRTPSQASRPAPRQPPAGPASPSPPVSRASRPHRQQRRGHPPLPVTAPTPRNRLPIPGHTRAAPRRRPRRARHHPGRRTPRRVHHQPDQGLPTQETTRTTPYVPGCLETPVQDVSRHTAPPAGLEPATHGLGTGIWAAIRQCELVLDGRVVAGQMAFRWPSGGPSETVWNHRGPSGTADSAIERWTDGWPEARDRASQMETVGMWRPCRERFEVGRNREPRRDRRRPLRRSRTLDCLVSRLFAGRGIPKAL